MTTINSTMAAIMTKRSMVKRFFGAVQRSMRCLWGWVVMLLSPFWFLCSWVWGNINFVVCGIVYMACDGIRMGVMVNGRGFWRRGTKKAHGHLYRLR